MLVMTGNRLCCLSNAKLVHSEGPDPHANGHDVRVELRGNEKARDGAKGPVAPEWFACPFHLLCNRSCLSIGCH